MATRIFGVALKTPARSFCRGAGGFCCSSPVRRGRKRSRAGKRWDSKCSISSSMWMDSSALTAEKTLACSAGQRRRRVADGTGMPACGAGSSELALLEGEGGLGREFLEDILPGCNELGSLLDECVGVQACLLVTLPGTAKTSRHCSRAQREVMRVPLNSPASTTRTPRESPLMMRLRKGNCADWGRWRGEIR